MHSGGYHVFTTPRCPDVTRQHAGRASPLHSRSSRGIIWPPALLSCLLMNIHRVSKNGPIRHYVLVVPTNSLILLILGKQHQHTCGSDQRLQFSLSLHFYLLYLLLNSCKGHNSQVTHRSGRSMRPSRLQSRNRPIFLFRSNSNFDLKPFSLCRYSVLIQHISV